MSTNWCTIESDPGVFSELLESMGANNVAVEELFTLSSESLASISPAYGLLFLFKWTKETSTGGGLPLKQDQVDPDLFFAKQVVHNACATQALLSVLLNSESSHVGQTLQGFKDFVKDFSFEMRGETLGNYDEIRQAHNRFTRPEPLGSAEDAAASTGGRKKKVDEDDDDAAYHFIAYVPFKGGIYELDGLQDGPILLVPPPNDTSEGYTHEDSAWMSAVYPHIERRIQRYSITEIRFNLMAVIQDRRTLWAERVAKAEANGDTNEATRCQEELKDAEERRRVWMKENVRRRYNYTPFVFAAVKHLEKQKKMRGLVRAAQEKEQQKQAARQ